MLASYGLPLARLRFEFVHGCTYVRPIGVGEGDKPGPTPPTWKLHDRLRRRRSWLVSLPLRQSGERTCDRTRTQIAPGLGISS